MTKDLIVYWAPSKFTSFEEQWNMLYSEPTPVADSLVNNVTQGTQMVRCPATRAVLKNIFSLNSNIEENVDLTAVDLKLIAEDNTNDQYRLDLNSSVAIFKERASSFDGYVNITYNLGWLFFSEEPLTVKICSPYFPTTTPVSGSIMSVGEFDIGRWFRPFNIDYHIPTESESFKIKLGDPLAFLEFKTDKKIIFKRFKPTPEILALSREFSDSSANYGIKKTLKQRYEMAKRSGVMSLVSSEIKKNLVG